MMYEVCIPGVVPGEVKYYHAGTQFSNFSYSKATELTHSQAEAIRSLYDRSYIISEDHPDYLKGKSDDILRIKKDLMDYREEKAKTSYVDALTLALKFLDSYNPNEPFSEEKAKKIIDSFYGKDDE